MTMAFPWKCLKVRENSLVCFCTQKEKKEKKIFVQSKLWRAWRKQQQKKKLITFHFAFVFDQIEVKKKAKERKKTKKKAILLSRSRNVIKYIKKILHDVNAFLVVSR